MRQVTVFRREWHSGRWMQEYMQSDGADNGTHQRYTTIKDIAKQAEISTSTIARIVRDEFNRTGAEVLDITDMLNRYAASARRARRKKAALRSGRKSKTPAERLAIRVAAGYKAGQTRRTHQGTGPASALYKAGAS